MDDRGPGPEEAPVLPQFPLPSWLDGFDSAVGLMALIGWVGFAVLAVLVGVLVSRELGRRRRVALADAAARSSAGGDDAVGQPDRLSR